MIGNLQTAVKLKINQIFIYFTALNPCHCKLVCLHCSAVTNATELFMLNLGLIDI